MEQFWDMRSRSYDRQVEEYYRDAYDRTVAGAVKYLKPEDRVLDFACGTGIVTHRMAPYAGSVLGIDQAAGMVEKAREKGCGDNVEIRQMDLFAPELAEGSFDVVTAFNVLCYVKDHPRVLGRIWSLLKPGGHFLSATDCLGEKLTRVGMQKWLKSRTGRMPYVAFDTMQKLEAKVTEAGFQVLERENLFPAPPNLFLAARKP